MDKSYVPKHMRVVPVEPSGTVEPAEPAEPAELVDLDEHIEPAEPAEVIESVEPTEAIEPAETIEPAESVEPAEKIEPAEPVGLAESVEPAEPVAPVASVESAETIESVGPAEPIEPAEPVDTFAQAAQASSDSTAVLPRLTPTKLGVGAEPARRRVPAVPMIDAEPSGISVPEPAPAVAPELAAAESPESEVEATTAFAPVPAAEPVPADDSAPEPAPASEPEPALAVEPAPSAVPEPEPALAEAASEESVGRSAAMMSVLVIISRITGFVRTWAQAMALGVTVMASCYTVANNLPNMLYELVMGGMLATAFLPVYLSVKERAGREGANRYTSNLLTIVLLFMGLLTVLGIVFAAQVVWTQSFNATAEFDFDLATLFFRFFALEVVLYACSSIISGVLNAERDYLWSNAAPIFNNIVCTASFFLYAAFADKNPQLAIMCLAIGNPLGVAIQVVMQLPSLKKHGIRLRPRIDLHDPALRETLSIGIPSLVVTICSTVTTSVQTSSALSVTVSGSSIAYYTRIWYTLPYSIFAIPVTTAMFTELSNYVSRGDMKSTARGVSFGTSKILFMLIPFTFYLVAFSRPLIMLMAGGRFTYDQIILTAHYLAVLALSLPMYGVCTYQQKVCSSLRRMSLYMVAIALGSVMQVAFCLLLTPHFGLMMVPLSSLFFFTLVDIVTFASLRKQLGNMGLTSVLASSAKAFVLGGMGALAGYGVMRAMEMLMGPLNGSMLQSLVYTAVGGSVAVLVTFGIAVARNMPEAATFTRIINRFLPS